MTTTRVLQRSFAGGEVTPEFHGRIDDAKYQSGLATCKNFIVFPHGPVGNRGGTKYVNSVKTAAKKTRLIPFTFSTTQTMVLEFGDQYIRFHTLGATLLDGSNAIYEIATPYVEAHLFDLHYVQSADVMTITHPSYTVRELKRLGATNWTLTAPSFGSPITSPLGSGLSATAAGHSTVKYTYSYVATTIGADEISESAASIAVSAGGNLLEQGGKVTIAWNAVTNATRYNVYKLQGGIYGFIGQTTGTSIIDDNIAPDMGQTPPNYDSVFVTTNNYPGAVSYFEQRRVFAGTNLEPSNIWMTKSGTESNMSFRIPVVDDDRIAFRVAAREANTIRHVVPLTEMILLTSAAEWRVTSQNSDAITPSTISVKPQSYIGASNVQPVIVNNSLIYAAARGGHVRELGYNWQASGFITGDLSVRAPHLFDEHLIEDMAYSKAPYPIAWFVRDDGVLLGLTYMPEQGIGAWHQHNTTNGAFESVCCVAEGNDDVVYVVVKRTISGATVRYIERMQPRYFDTPSDAFFVDSGLTFNGTNTGSVTMTISGGTNYTTAEQLTLTSSTAQFLNPVGADAGDAIVLTDTDGVEYTLTIETTTSTSIAKVRTDKTIPSSLRASARTTWAFARDAMSGLSHLEGQTVSILADGAVHPRRVVTSGAIALDAPSRVVQIGLPITADLETLPITIQMEAFGQGRFKNINQVSLRVFKSSGIFVGPNENNLTEFKQRTTETYGSPPALKTEELRMPISPSWNDSGQIFVRQSDPLPITIVAVTSEVTLGG